MPNKNQDKPISIFISYAHEDESFQKILSKHLSTLKREGLIKEWYDRGIVAGSEWEEEIKTNFESSDIILLLISPDFIASDYCWNKETIAAIQKHENKTAFVVPIIVRPTDWEKTELGKLQALPTDAKAISEWENQDSAYKTVVVCIRELCEKIRGGQDAQIEHQKPLAKRKPTQVIASPPPQPRFRTLQEILLGNWNVQIVNPFNLTVISVFSFFSNGFFEGQLNMGISSVRGTWMTINNLLTLSGQETIGFLTNPYFVEIQLNIISENTFNGLTKVGERVFFQRII